MKSEYYQIPKAEEHKERAAFMAGPLDSLSIIG